MIKLMAAEMVFIVGTPVTKAVPWLVNASTTEVSSVLICTRLIRLPIPYELKPN
jgi:hypothetical protein